MTKVLTIRNLFVLFGEQSILKNISLSIEQGKYVMILGANGSGKTTLLKSMMGLIEPTSGEVNTQGTMGILFQNPENQFIAATVEEDIAFGLENKKVPTDDMHQMVNHVLNELDLTPYRQHQPKQLSGGQKQKVAFAGLFAFDPDIYFLDEAFSMIDQEAKKEIHLKIKRLHREQKKTIVHITHTMEDILDADEVIVLSEGQLVFQGTPNKLFYEDIEQWKLVRPFYQQLEKSLTEVQIPIEHVHSPKGAVDALWRFFSNK